MKKVNVYVTLRESVLDPQGVAVKGGLEHLGFAGVESVRIGKVIELQVADHTTENMVKEIVTDSFKLCQLQKQKEKKQLVKSESETCPLHQSICE